MSKNTNIIEINGQRYDATTGALLGSSGSPAKRTKPQPPAKSGAAPQRRPKPAAPAVSRQPAKQPASRHPEPSRTLMRQAVKRPSASLKRRHKAQGSTDALAAKPLSQVLVKPSVKRLDEERLRHAQQIEHSRLITRFPAFTPAAAPAANTEPTKTGPAAARQPVHADAGSRTAQLHQTHSAAAHGHPPKRPKTTADILERALERANSHLQPPEPLPRKGRHDRLKRNTGIGAAIGLSVLILGVIIVQNLGNVRLQMASAKAGFNVNLPGYHPAGYGLGSLDYSSGVAAAQFHSYSNDQRYTITQKRSSWDSTDLRDNFVAPDYAQYQTVSADGRTIYLYGDGNATWVNGGVWYVIQSNGSLSSPQLVDLATSL